MHRDDTDLSTAHTVGGHLSTCVATFWHRGKSKVNHLLRNALLERRAAHESTCRIPYDIVEVIIAHLTHDLATLKSCSLTCHSWYIVTTSHLHHTLTLRRDVPTITRGKVDPPTVRDRLKPLSKLRELGLTSLVKEIRVEQWRSLGPWFLPQAFSRRGLRNFSTFANVQTLKLQGVELHHFTPDVERYFGHLSSTLRSITLYKPHCTPRQLSHFLSLFSTLDDVEIWGIDTHLPNTATSDTELVPFSAPKLRGRLVLHYFCWVDTWTYFITSCGGLRFRDMDLRGSTSCAPILLEACAGTLETLRFDARDSSISEWHHRFIYWFELMANRASPLLIPWT
jgi:hypothetical protein